MIGGKGRGRETGMTTTDTVDTVPGHPAHPGVESTVAETTHPDVTGMIASTRVDTETTIAAATTALDVETGETMTVVIATNVKAATVVNVTITVSPLLVSTQSTVITNPTVTAMGMTRVTSNLTTLVLVQWIWPTDLFLPASNLQLPCHSTAPTLTSMLNVRLVLPQ